jgi:hypothetical protein
MKRIKSKFIFFLLLAGILWSGCENPTNNNSGDQVPAVQVPGAPSDLTVTEADSRLTVSWTAVDHAAAYEVWYGTESGGGDRRQSGGDVTRSARTLVQTSASISGLTNNKTYYVWVRAKNSAGTGGFSSAAMGTPRAVFAPPQALGTAPEIEAGDGQLIVQWTPAEGASTYEVYFGASSDGTGRWKLDGDVSGTAVTIGNLTNGTAYYVWVRGKNSAGTGDFSAPGSGTPRSADKPPAAPAAPAVTPGNTRLEVSWEPAEAASAYEVWYGTESSGTGRGQFGGDISGTTVSISGLKNGTAYYVWVRGKNSAGTGDFSAPGSGTPSQPPAAVPAPAVNPGNARLEVSWEPAEAAESYEVWYGAESSGTGRRKFGEDVSGTAAVITGLTNGETYYVWIKAKNSGGTGDFSPPASGTPQAGSAGDEPGPGNETEWDGLIRIEYADIIRGTESVNPGQPAAVFTFPEVGAPWALSLESGAGSAHNRKFRIEGNAVVINEALDFGDFYVRVKIQGASYAAVKQLTFRVQQTPAEFSIPPLAGAVMTGENTYKLAVSWPRRMGADGYRVYIGRTQDSAAAVQAGGDYLGDIFSAEILSYPGESGRLPCDTEYYVWVRAFNGQGSTGFSPAAVRRTGDPVPDVVWGTWKSQFSEAYDLERAELKLSYGYISQDGENWGFGGTMVYHKDFGVQTRPSVGTGLGNVTGGAGVLIFKFAEGSNDYGTGSDYYAVYYWGLGAVSPPGNYSEGSKLLHMANAWQVIPSTAPPPPTFTAAEAEDLFTEANQNRFIGWNIVWPQYLYRGEGAFAGTSFTELASWLESQPVNTPDAPYSAAVSGVNLRGLEALGSSPVSSDPWGWLFDKLKARFVNLDIDACTGATVGYANNQMGDGRNNPDREKLVSVRLPSAATRVSRFLFNGCANLRSVVFPSSLQTIGGGAFRGCTALASVNIPASITRIDQEAFQGCTGLTSVTIRANTPPTAQDNTTVTSSATGTMAQYSVFSGCDSAVFYVPAGRESAYAAALGVPASRVQAIGP